MIDVRKGLYNYTVVFYRDRKYLMFYFNYSEGRERINNSSTVIRIQNMINPPVIFYFSKNSRKFIAITLSYSVSNISIL
jgi:hypothetical protein